MHWDHRCHIFFFFSFKKFIIQGPRDVSSMVVICKRTHPHESLFESGDLIFRGGERGAVEDIQSGTLQLSLTESESVNQILGSCGGQGELIFQQNPTIDVLEKGGKF